MTNGTMRGSRSGRATTVKFACAILAFVVAACRQDMHDQPRFKPYAKNDFFEDRRSARPLPEGTVARGALRADAALYAGKQGKDFVASFPVSVDEKLLRRGHERFDIYCSPCHGRTGAGNGMVVQRGFKQPPSLHIERLRRVPPGYLFDVMTNGFGAMQDYAAQVPVADRWAIAAYVRALQLSQNAPVDIVPADRRAELDRPAPSAAAEEHHR